MASIHLAVTKWANHRFQRCIRFRSNVRFRTYILVFTLENGFFHGCAVPAHVESAGDHFAALLTLPLRALGFIRLACIGVDKGRLIRNACITRSLHKRFQPVMRFLLGAVWRAASDYLSRQLIIRDFLKNAAAVTADGTVVADPF
ncbi:MAG: hypothetical protein ACYC6N_21010 [Pirellulaceae bacterium]